VSQLQVGPLRIDVAVHTVDVDDGAAISLTRRELELVRSIDGDPSPSAVARIVR
jgi:DNA-binding response OmpR family regulator